MNTILNQSIINKLTTYSLPRRYKEEYKSYRKEWNQDLQVVIEELEDSIQT